MFVDIHTHNKYSKDFIAIRNLSLIEAGQVLSGENTAFFSVGIHPWNTDEYSEQWLTVLFENASNHRVVAIGECGLDKNISTTLEKQIVIFEKQIVISEKIKKPLLIHCVGYFNELMAVRKQWNPEQQWIIHGFRGKPQLARQLLNAGMALSYGEKFNTDSLKITTLSELYIETDESKLSICEIYKMIAAAKGCEISALSAGYDLMKKYC